MEYFVLFVLGGLLLGAFFFGAMIPYSVSETACRDVPGGLAACLFPRVCRAKYYAAERQWVRRGFMACTMGLFLSLTFMYFFYFGSRGFIVPVPVPGHENARPEAVESSRSGSAPHDATSRHDE